MPPNPRSLRAIRREFRVYFHAVLVQIELVSKPLGWNSQKSVWVFQDLAPQRYPKNYSQVFDERSKKFVQVHVKKKAVCNFVLHQF